MRRHPRAGDKDTRTIALGVGHDLLRPLRTAMRGRDFHLVRNAHFIERRTRLRHDLGVGIATHDDANPHGANVSSGCISCAALWSAVARPPLWEGGGRVIPRSA